VPNQYKFTFSGVGKNTYSNGVNRLMIVLVRPRQLAHIHFPQHNAWPVQTNFFGRKKKGKNTYSNGVNRLMIVLVRPQQLAYLHFRCSRPYSFSLHLPMYIFVASIHFRCTYPYTFSLQVAVVGMYMGKLLAGELSDHSNLPIYIFHSTVPNQWKFTFSGKKTYSNGVNRLMIVLVRPRQLARAHFPQHNA